MTELTNQELDTIIGGAGSSSGKATVSCDTLNVRKEPSGDVIGHLHKGDKVTVHGTKSGWCQITFKGSIAYVWKEYLKF